MTATVVPVAGPAPDIVDRPTTAPRARADRERWWGMALFAAAAIGYLGVGVYLYLVAGYINPDASSRVGNAAFTILSRDPHLGAIGFVWNPLPSLVEIPLVEAFEHWPATRWPQLRHVGFEGAIMSALFMAGGVWQVRRIALDYRAGRALRWAAVLAFAVNPMILLYGGMGMSEAPFLFFLLWACRRMLCWVRRRGVGDLVCAGAALGFGYLTRYEAIVAAVAVTVGVFWVSTLHHRSSATHRWQSYCAGAAFGVHDAVIVGLPTAFAFALWAGVGWILDGNAFSQFSSQYGNAAQVAVAGIASADEVGTTPLARSVAAGLLGMQPLLLVVAVVVTWTAIRTRTVDAAVVLAVFGSVLVFQIAAVLVGSTFGWFRFYLTVIPLVVIAVLVAGGVGRHHSATGWPRVSAVLMVLVLVTSIPVTAQTMLSPGIAKEEYGLRSAFWPQRYPPDTYWFYWFGDVSRNVARWLDDQHLPDGSVLVDTFGLARIWLYSDRPQQFVIRSDFDFFPKLNNPATRGVQYILSQRPTGLGALDAINVRYPGMWDDGAQIATAAMTVVGPDGRPQLRIYRVAGVSP
ncbi:glycosyltransferase family 39 protein [Gordonia sp. VNK1]|uniref:ArnT family glycosyltransferase n=1 Tax=Gordonia oleivorans TaxID=3156618 RepID=UPI0032B45129